MSDYEFENYLALLKRLLRLRGKQQAQIAAELRAHLEDRLDELLARGVPRDEAVKRALEEFGDAAGLAGEFVSISRTRRRRWLMRVTTFSVAATVLVAAGIAIFWPGRNAAPGVAAVVAQAPAKDPPQAEDPRPSAAKTDGPKAAEVRTLQEKLNQRVELAFIEQPLQDVIQHLHDATGIKFYMKAKKLEEAGIALDTAVSIQFSDTRLSTVLDLLLESQELTYVEKDDIIVITTPEDAEATLEIRVYDCRDLLTMEAPPGADKFVPAGALRAGGGGFFAVEDQVPSSPAPSAGGPPPGIGEGGFGGEAQGTIEPVSEHDLRARRLMNIITTNVDSPSWDDVGGPGSISEYNGLIVVTQTAQTHKKVERVLDMLREAAGIAEPEQARKNVVR